MNDSDANAHQPTESGREAAPSMVALVARALHAADCYAGPVTERFEDLSDWERAAFRLMARKAIEAMREPTQTMAYAATRLAPTWDDPTSVAKWQAMIDAALAPDGGAGVPVHTPKPNAGEV